jgi:hypothetical protein
MLKKLRKRESLGQGIMNGTTEVGMGIKPCDGGSCFQGYHNFQGLARRIWQRLLARPDAGFPTGLSMATPAKSEPSAVNHLINKMTMRLVLLVLYYAVDLRDHHPCRQVVIGLIWDGVAIC